MNIDYVVNPHIVRGLDYYTNTVFEFVSSAIGAQGTVCGGGRYNGLIKELSGDSIPACGFGMGIERLMLLLAANGTDLPKELPPILYVIPASPEYSFEAMRIVYELRDIGVYAITDLSDRSLKAQMKYANKRDVMFTAVLGGEEIESRTIKIKDMSNGETLEFELDGFVDDFEYFVGEMMCASLFGEDEDDGDDDFDGDGSGDGIGSGLSLLNGGKK